MRPSKKRKGKKEAINNCTSLWERIDNRIWQKIVAVCFVIKGLRAEEEEEEEARGNEMDAVVKAVIEAIHASPTHAVLYLSGGGSQVTTSHIPRSLWNL
jgi:hypothetical protein